LRRQRQVQCRDPAPWGYAATDGVSLVSGLRIACWLDFGTARWIERAVEIDMFGVFGWVQGVIKVYLRLVFLRRTWRRIGVGQWFRFLVRHD
jgi:hypothetical protein